MGTSMVSLLMAIILLHSSSVESFGGLSVPCLTRIVGSAGSLSSGGGFHTTYGIGSHPPLPPFGMLRGAKSLTICSVTPPKPSGGAKNGDSPNAKRPSKLNSERGEKTEFDKYKSLNFRLMALDSAQDILDALPQPSAKGQPRPLNAVNLATALGRLARSRSSGDVLSTDPRFEFLCNELVGVLQDTPDEMEERQIAQAAW